MTDEQVIRWATTEFPLIYEADLNAFLSSDLSVFAVNRDNDRSKDWTGFIEMSLMRQFAEQADRIYRSAFLQGKLEQASNTADMWSDNLSEKESTQFIESQEDSIRDEIIELQKELESKDKSNE